MSLEAKLDKWTAPSSDTEQEKQDRTEGMIRAAIREHSAFQSCSLNVFAKGSYANNTNVRADSDVDIAVEMTDLFYWDEAEPGASSGRVTQYRGDWTPEKLRAEVTRALEKKFPGQVRSTGTVALEINSGTARVDADVVPCFSYRYYFAGGNYRAGTKIFATNGRTIVNYPVQQLENGRAKNVRTGYAFKKAVRILKRLENELAGAGKYKELPSYFMECLGYNCTDRAFAHHTWTDVTRDVLFQIWDGLQGKEPDSADRKWLEVNECFYLFHDGQKWSREDGRGFAHAAWNHLGLK